MRRVKDDLLKRKETENIGLFYEVPSMLLLLLLPPLLLLPLPPALLPLLLLRLPRLLQLRCC